MFWKKSDTDYINSVRRWVRWSKRFAVLYAVILVAWVVILVLWHLMLERISTTFELAGDEAASLAFMLGALTTVFWFACAFVLFMLLGSVTMRPWILLVAYHDRLNKAGLIDGGGHGPSKHQN